MSDYIQRLIEYALDCYRQSPTALKVTGGVVAGSVGTLMVSRLFLDSYYFIHLGNGILCGLFGGKDDFGLFDELVLSSRTCPTDLDHMVHMNNGRYNREGDFGRHALLARLGFYKAMKKLRKETGVKKTFGLAATTIRFRRSLELFDAFWLKTRMVYWDEKSLYMEQRFERKKDNFIMAIMYAKLQFVGMTAPEFIEKMGYGGVECPEPPADLVHWIKYIEESSRALCPSRL